jgi:5''/3''-nucleotidase SurE
MDEKKTIILISNDDGVYAKGIKQLAEAVRPLGEVVVVAPDGPRSGMSSAITSEIPLRVSLLKKEDGLTVYSCTGTPVDCIKLGINELLDRKPDLVITGINHGSNAAISVLYSGTMGAAFEGCIFGVPSLGISLTDHSCDADFSRAAACARNAAKKILDGSVQLPSGVCLNINVPNRPDIKGIKICKQAKGQWTAEFMKSNDGGGRNVYWLTGFFEEANKEDQTTDEWALKNGYISIVPCKIDMTAHGMIEQLENSLDLDIH